MGLPISGELNISRRAVLKRELYVNENGKAAIRAGAGNDYKVRRAAIHNASKRVDVDACAANGRHAANFFIGDIVRLPIACSGNITTRDFDRDGKQTELDASLTLKLRFS